MNETPPDAHSLPSPAWLGRRRASQSAIALRDCGLSGVPPGDEPAAAMVRRQPGLPRLWCQTIPRLHALGFWSPGIATEDPVFQPRPVPAAPFVERIRSAAGRRML